MRYREKTRIHVAKRGLELEDRRETLAMGEE